MAEKVRLTRQVVVDQEDKIIGYKERRTLRKGDLYRVSALWITNGKGDVLLARRAFTKSHDPGKWGPAVAGTVEEGETYDSNIIKEAEEELGLTGIKPKKGPKERVFGQYNYFCQWYFLTLDKDINDFNVDRSEVEEIKWFPRKELLRQIAENSADFLESMTKWVNLFC